MSPCAVSACPPLQASATSGWASRLSTSRPSWCAPTRRSTSTSLSPRPTAEAGPAATSGSRSPPRVAEAAAAATTRIWSKRSIRRSVDCHSGSVSFVDRARSVSRITFLKQTRLHVHRLASGENTRGRSRLSGVRASGGICYISRVRMCAVHAKGTLYRRTSFQNLTVGCAPLAPVNLHRLPPHSESGHTTINLHTQPSLRQHTALRAPTRARRHVASYTDPP